MEVTIHHEHHHGRWKRACARSCSWCRRRCADRDVLDEMRNEIEWLPVGLREDEGARARAGRDPRSGERAAVRSQGRGRGARRDVEIVRAEAEAARDAATNATKARAAGEAAFAAMRAAARAQARVRRGGTDAARADADEAHARGAPGARADADAAARQRAEESAAARRHNDVRRGQGPRERTEGGGRGARGGGPCAPPWRAPRPARPPPSLSDGAPSRRAGGRRQAAARLAGREKGRGRSPWRSGVISTRRRGRAPRIRERPRDVNRHGIASRPGGAGRGRGARDGGPRVGARLRQARRRRGDERS